MNPKYTREDFRYLTDKEISKYDLKDPVQAEDAKKMDTEKRMAEEKAVAKDFVQLAEDIKNQSQRSNEEDKEQLARCIHACGGDEWAGLDMFVYQRPDYRAELNSYSKDATIRSKFAYAKTAALAGEEALKRYYKTESDSTVKEMLKEMVRATEYTTDNPGVLNTIQNTVAQQIMFRAARESDVLSKIQTINIPYGDYTLPYYNKYAVATYLAENGTITNYNDYLADGTSGIKNTKWTPRDFALGLKQSFRTLSKLSPSILNQQFDFIANSLRVGMEYQAISGSGAGVNDTGMVTGATSVTNDGNDYTTLNRAIAQVEKVRARVNMIVMNAESWAKFANLAVVNLAYLNKITGNNSGGNAVDIAGRTINGLKVSIVDDQVLATAGGSATVLLGDASHYMVVETGTLKRYQLDSPLAMTRETAFHVLRDGNVIFSDSFAKFTVAITA